jgi:hypothetical protein
MPSSWLSSGRTGPARALACVTILALSACGTDRPSGPDAAGGATDSLLPPDSTGTPQDTVLDTLPPVDTLPVDSLPPDSLLPPIDSTPPPPPYTGIPFGPFSLWKSNSELAERSTAFTFSLNSDVPGGIITRITYARRLGQKLVIAMTGGHHSRYITNGKFDLAKWKARQDLFDRPAIKAAVAAGLADGTIIAADIMDEPQHFLWGGALSKPLLDNMATYVKNMFPGIAIGVSTRWDWHPDERYKVVDYIATQYVVRFGPITEWRDQALAMARQNGISIMFALNPINGGTRIPGCPLGPTGGDGTYGGNCRITADQLREFGSTLGVAGCGLLLWRYNTRFMSNPANREAFKDVAEVLATRKAPPCRRQS